MIRTIKWTLNASKDIEYWKTHDRKRYGRIKVLINDIQKNPFTGIGKPEALKYSLSGLWSRRINQEHRLIYSITDTEIIIYNCRFHYKK
jgi:toxin YoeB